jgi:deoxyribonuclease-1-like protein
MIQLAWRWPILALLAGGGILLFRNYRIGGIEHLYLEPRPQAQSTGLGGLFSQQGSIFDSGSGSLATSAGLESLPGWRSNLTMGEKVALLEESTAQGASSTPLSSAESQYSVPPIPMPKGFPATLTDLANSQHGLTPLPNVNLATSERLAPPLEIPGTTSLPGTSGALPGTTASNSPRANPFPGRSAARPPGNMTSTTLATSLFDSSKIHSAGRTIRVGSFNTGSLGATRLGKAHVVESIVKILRSFDVVALQGIRSQRDDILPTIVERLNQTDRKYDYLIGPRVGRTAEKVQFAIVFDTERLETDRYQLYTVRDPDDLMNYEPLVAWFRCKGVPENEAFTFSLINVQLDRHMADAERKIIGSLVDEVRNDGRQEDDWIIAGDFQGPSYELSVLDPNQVRFAVREIPTNVAATQSCQNILFSVVASTEYTGRCGSLDFLRKYNLSLERALEVSEHLPVWAEFSIVEGAEPGRVAPPANNGVL